jgi:penicillin-binding protein 2
MQIQMLKNINVRAIPFAGFGPVEEPKYAVAVVAEHAGPGSRIAAPIASSMFDFLFKKRISNA